MKLHAQSIVNCHAFSEGLKARHTTAGGEAPDSRPAIRPSPEGARRPACSILAFTITELLIVLCILVGLALLVMPSVVKAKAKADRIRCSSFLKQVGLAHKVFANDHTNSLTGLEECPARTSTNFGGSMEYIGTGNVGRHYQAMSNELGSAKILVCPADKGRIRRADFVIPMTNSNISYAVGVDASELTPDAILSADWNIESKFPRRAGILELNVSNTISWGSQLHRGVGNIGLADGSVQQLTSVGLWDQALLSFRELETNRLEFP